MKKTTSKTIIQKNNDTLEIPIKKLTSEEQIYIDSLNEKEKKAYEIAKSHLGTTFHLMKSNGFIQWKK